MSAAIIALGRCKHCRKRMPGGVLHEDCVDPWLAAQARKKEAARKREEAAARKAERARDREKREAMLTIPQLTKKAQKAFNAFIRARDAGQLCICCRKPLGQSTVGGRYDAGHYRSISTAAHLRFNEANCHAQRKRCNHHGGGRAVDYRIGLVERIGQEAVDHLESNNDPRSWTREELIAIEAMYVRKLKELRTVTAGSR